MEEDLYAVLGVQPSSTVEEIKRAYRKKALLCHPDKNPDNPNAVKKFHLITKASNILTNATTRAEYDRNRNFMRQGACSFSEPEDDVEDLLEPLFKKFRHDMDQMFREEEEMFRWHEHFEHHILHNFSRGGRGGRCTSHSQRGRKKSSTQTSQSSKHSKCNKTSGLHQKAGNKNKKPDKRSHKSNFSAGFSRNSSRPGHHHTRNNKRGGNYSHNHCTHCGCGCGHNVFESSFPMHFFNFPDEESDSSDSDLEEVYFKPPLIVIDDDSDYDDDDDICVINSYTIHL